jgi:exosome complex component RRP46
MAAAAQKRRRPDGRQTNGSLRPLAAEVSTLHRADGSASLSSGSTTVLAAVYGPLAPRNPSRERSDGAIVSVVFRHSSSSADDAGAAKAAYGSTEREVERFLADALAATVRTDAYPRTVIEVVVQIVKSDGSAVGTALNAAVLALMDAGVEMVGLPVATTCLVTGTGTDDGGDGGKKFELRLDPCGEEEASGEGAVVIVVTKSSRISAGAATTGNGIGAGILSSMSFGTTSLEAFLAACEGSARASKAVLAFLRLAVEQKVTREAQTLWST